MHYPTMYSGIYNLSVQTANKFSKFHSEMFKGETPAPKARNQYSWCLHYPVRIKDRTFLIK